MRSSTLKAIQTARKLVSALKEGQTLNVNKSSLVYAEALVDLIGDPLLEHASVSPRPSKVVEVLNQGTLIFQAFRAEDWRNLAQECMRQADRLTCIDCGCDLSLPDAGLQPDPKCAHWRHKGQGTR
jgi:hypothetical protein